MFLTGQFFKLLQMMFWEFLKQNVDKLDAFLPSNSTEAQKAIQVNSLLMTTCIW